jgi:hypothetical protein
VLFEALEGYVIGRQGCAEAGTSRRQLNLCSDGNINAFVSFHLANSIMLFDSVELRSFFLLNPSTSCLVATQSVNFSSWAMKHPHYDQSSRPARD